MPAPPRIDYHGLPGTGVELFGVDAPEFRDLLKPCSSAAADRMWLAVIVQNASPKALTAVLVHYEASESGGRTHAVDFLWHTTQNLEHRKARPGESVLVDPVLGLPGSCGRASKRLGAAEMRPPARSDWPGLRRRSGCRCGWTP